MKKIDQLTVTRFLAALSVILFHSGGVFPFNIRPFSLLFASGQIPVSYFFVLSGFVMSLAYYRPEKKLNMSDYYFSRFSRIYPSYILSFIIVCLYYIDLMAKVDFKKILANLFLLQAWIPSYVFSFNYVAWSLSVEVFLYLIFPLLISLFVRFSLQRLISYVVIFWGISLIIHASLLAFLLPENLYIQNPLVYLSGFILGVAGGIWYLQINKKNVKQKVNFVLLLSGLAVLVFVLMMEKRYVPPELDTALLAPIFVLIILTLALDTTFVSKMLSHKWLVLLGDASYTLFILNIPIRFFMERAVDNSQLQISNNVFYYFFIPFITLLSVFIYRKFELPARKWLMGNRQMTWLFVWDVVAIVLAVLLAFFLRLGAYDLYLYNWRIFTFTVCLAVPIAMMFLLLFHFYQPKILFASSTTLIYQLITPILLSGFFLSGALYWAFQNGIIEYFPRSVLLLSFFTIFGFAYLTRFLFQRRNIQLQIIDKP